MYSGAIMSAKLRASQRAHRAHCAKKQLAQNYQTPKYQHDGHSTTTAQFGGGRTRPSSGGQLCRNLSIFSGGKKRDQLPGAEGEEGSPPGSMGRRGISVGGSSLFPRRSQAKRQWSIQAVKGKVTTSCLWNACKALTLGAVLILIGAGMATMGYYAEEEQLRRLSSNGSSTSSSTSSSTTDHNHYFLAHPHSPHLSSSHDVVGANSSSPHWPLPPNTLIRGGRPPPPHVNFNSDYNVVTTNGREGGRGADGARRADEHSDNNNNTRGEEETVVHVPASGIGLESFGLNKLAYIGPIVMGFGGFVIVAACVMTFEARDSAAKIVPARFRKSFPEKTPVNEEDPGIRHAEAQTKFDSVGGMYATDSNSQSNDGREINRRAMTSAFIKFSKTLQTSVDSSAEYYEQRGGQLLVKCPSAPSLVREFLQDEKRLAGMEAPRILRVCAPRPQVRRLSTNVLPRQTMSVDNPAMREVYTAAIPGFVGERNSDEGMELGASATAVHQTESESNLVMDLHLPQCAVTLMVQDSSRSPSVKADVEEALSAAGSSAAEQESEAAGTSGSKTCVKVDKETSTVETGPFTSFGWSKETTDSNEVLTYRTSKGGSFRESKRPRSSRHVKRSETIDTASTHHRRHHHHSHHTHSQHLQSSQRTSSTRSVSGRSSADSGRKLVSGRNDTAKRHPLLRQPKVETEGSHDDLSKTHDPFSV